MDFPGSCKHGEVDERALLALESRAVPNGTPAVGSGEFLHGAGKLSAAVFEGVVNIGVSEDFAAVFHADLVEGFLALDSVRHFGWFLRMCWRNFGIVQL